MQTAVDTIKHALSLHDESAARVEELSKAVQALDPARNNHFASVHCSLSIAQGAAWTVEINAATALIQPLFEAALLKERDRLANMKSRLEAARSAMQRQSD